jgi:hypothetical protein
LDQPKSSKFAQVCKCRASNKQNKFRKVPVGR